MLDLDHDYLLMMTSIITKMLAHMNYLIKYVISNNDVICGNSFIYVVNSN